MINTCVAQCFTKSANLWPLKNFSSNFLSPFPWIRIFACSDQDTYVESTPGGSLLPPPVNSILKLFLLNLALCLEEKKKKSFVVLRIAQSVSQCFTPRGSSPSVLGQEGTCARTWGVVPPAVWTPGSHSPGPPQGLKSSYWWALNSHCR